MLTVSVLNCVNRSTHIKKLIQPSGTPQRERERERERGGVCRNYIFSAREGGKANFPAWKISRQYPVVLVVKICLREGKALGSEKGKGLG
jgi:hypothetical protein